MRKQLICIIIILFALKRGLEIMGENNIGFWHLVNQIIFFEGMLKDFEK